MVINVTKQDYEKGKRFNAFDCPVALAVNRSLGGLAEVRAGEIKLHNGSTCVRIETPLTGELTERIYQFDTSGACVPFSFALVYDGPTLEMKYALSEDPVLQELEA